MHNIIEFMPGLAPRRVMAFVLPLAALALPLTVRADDSGYWVSAPVLSVDPVVVERTVERPVQHCTETTSAPAPAYRDRYERRESGFVPSLVGGLIGGLVGNQFSHGNGRKALTVVGALAGSSIANGIARERRREQAWATPVRRCYTTYEQDRVETIDGYHVLYEYGGQTFAKRTEQHPGDQVRVYVQVSPVGEG
jgi:uncharacterized protein YcfJ